MSAPSQPQGYVSWKVKAALAGSIAFVMGWSDVITYFRFRCFVSMMTGNMMLLAFSSVQTLFAEEDQRPLMNVGVRKPPFYVAVVLCWMASAFVYRLVSKKLSKRTASYFAPLVAVSTVTVCLVNHYTDFLSKNYDIEVCSVAPVFAIAAASTLRDGPAGFISNMFTGHLQTVAFELVSVVTGDKTKVLEALRKIGVSLTMITCFMLGAASAATSKEMLMWKSGLNNEASSQWLFLPIGPVLAIMLVINDFVYLPPSRLQLLREARRKRQEAKREARRAQEDQEAQAAATNGEEGGAGGVQPQLHRTLSSESNSSFASDMDEGSDEDMPAPFMSYYRTAVVRKPEPPPRALTFGANNPQRNVELTLGDPLMPPAHLRHTFPARVDS